MWQATLFRSSQAAAAVLSNVNIVPYTNDVQNNNALFPTDDYELYAAIAAGATITQSQVSSASINAVAPLQLRPVNLAATFGSNPNMTWWDNPFPKLYREEVTSVQDSNGAGAPELHSVVLFYGKNRINPPPGRRYRLHGRSSTAATANAWITNQVVWDQNIAAGRYAVIGMECVGATGILARLGILDQAWRPGVPVLATVGQRMFWPMYDCPFGVMGYFSTLSYPSLEYYSTAADATQDVWLDLVKVG